MEEVSEIFQTFLERIYTSQQQTNQLLQQFNNQSQAAEFIFDNFTSQSSQKIIDAHDLAKYYKQHKQTSTSHNETLQIIINYFKFPKSLKMDILHFRNILLPKSFSQEPSLQTYQFEISQLFTSIISAIITGFINVEEIREKLCENSQKVEGYFGSEYDAGERLTKQALRDFMYDHGIYMKHKFEWVVWYIFGDSVQAIQWNYFLTNKSSDDQMDTAKTIKGDGKFKEEGYLPLVHEATQENEESKTASFKQLQICLSQQDPSNNQPDNIRDLLKQISIIQQKINDKKSKRSSRQSKIQQLEQIRTNQQNEGLSQHLNESLNQELKINSKISVFAETRKFSEGKQNSTKERKYQSQDKYGNQYLERLYDKYGDRTYQTVTSTGYYQNWQSLYKNKENQGNIMGSKRSLNKSSSEAKLKIYEIEKKVNRMMGPKSNFNSYSHSTFPRYSQLCMNYEPKIGRSPTRKLESALSARRFLHRL